MKKEYDFSKGVRRKFFNPDGEFNLSIYLELEIADLVEKLSFEREVNKDQLVNKLVRNRVMKS